MHIASPGLYEEEEIKWEMAPETGRGKGEEQSAPAQEAGERPPSEWEGVELRVRRRLRWDQVIKGWVKLNAERSLGQHVSGSLQRVSEWWWGVWLRPTPDGDWRMAVVGIGGGKTPGLDPAAEIQRRNDDGPEPGCGSRDRGKWSGFLISDPISFPVKSFQETEPDTGTAEKFWALRTRPQIQDCQSMERRGWKLGYPSRGAVSSTASLPMNSGDEEQWNEPQPCPYTRMCPTELTTSTCGYQTSRDEVA